MTKIVGLRSPFGAHDRPTHGSRMLDPRSIDTLDTKGQSKMPKAAPRQDVDWYYNARVAVLFGVAQICCGLLCILLGSAAVAVTASHSEIAAGIWGGVIIIVAGCCAIWSGREKTHKSVLICFVMSLLAALASCLIFIVAGFGVSSDLQHVNDTSYFFHFEKTSRGNRGFPVLRYNQQILKASIAVHGLMITVAMFELVASVAQAVLCRYHRWCNKKGGSHHGGHGELAVIYESPKKSADNKICEKQRKEHYISREKPHDIRFYHVDESCKFSDCPRAYSDKPEYSDSSKTEYTSSSSAKRPRMDSCDHNSVFSEPDMESVGACAMNCHQEALLRSLLTQQ